MQALGANGLAALAARAGFAQIRRRFGVYDLRGGSARHARLLDGCLRLAGDGDRLMVHAAAADAAAGKRIAGARRVECEVTAGPPPDCSSRHGRSAWHS